ncbi:MAG: hypothetical protein HKN45_07775 [Flavobacteriales bacterium]|nr:hypothetical protein [Flavobacteriales bacterium]
MKTIYLNRHAKSSWNRPYTSDFERGLNKRGNTNAEYMSKRFALETKDVVIVSSPAVRALRTAIYFAEALDIENQNIKQVDLIYGASAREMLRLIQSFDDSWESVILFGHNPTFSELANLLDHSFNDHMVTCARVKIACEVKSWTHIIPDIGHVEYHDYPRLYAEMKDL